MSDDPTDIEGDAEPKAQTESTGLTPAEGAADINGEAEAAGDAATKPGMGGANPFKALRNTEPHKPVEEVDPPRKLKQYWKEYLWRGVGKVAGNDLNMAGVDLAAGTIGGALKLFESTDADEFQPEG